MSYDDWFFAPLRAQWDDEAEQDAYDLYVETLDPDETPMTFQQWREDCADARAEQRLSRMED